MDIQQRQHFDGVIGRLDRILSEFLLLSQLALDQADLQTIKHHAGDLIGVGNKALRNIAPPPQSEAEEVLEARKQFTEENPPWS